MFQADADKLTFLLEAEAELSELVVHEGPEVHSIDRLTYCHHIARAIVENDSRPVIDFSPLHSFRDFALMGGK